MMCLCVRHGGSECATLLCVLIHCAAGRRQQRLQSACSWLTGQPVEEGGPALLLHHAPPPVRPQHVLRQEGVLGWEVCSWGQYSKIRDTGGSGAVALPTPTHQHQYSAALEWQRAHSPHPTPLHALTPTLH